MNRCTLNDRQKALLRSIVPGLKANDDSVRSDWPLPRPNGDGSFLAFHGINDDEIHEYWRETARYEDLRAFVGCEFFEEHENYRFILFSENIINAEAHDFEMPSQLPASIVIHGDQYNVSETFNNSNVNIGSSLRNVSQTVALISHSDDAQKNELQQLLEQLKAELEKLPEHLREDSEAIVKSVEQIFLELQNDQPNRSWLRVTREGLVKAAEGVKEIAPSVLIAATQISQIIGRMFP